ncbi:MAG: NAD+ synthase [Deltaproteobacteria bacterium GWA2_38_16]|nr:MAG: NAD+ synthase [Deltaproteobacteria bacterium GWA2_38_16]OGQ02909.1 MAG: NAD+ synthase [Deltaproteobacteria bacterium RIFCSPHIGHO2_02_FULL_38_15]OGQ35079.1 MAG: NAD+ synthase [Deltaproteobacteria bacterium RIFCSPLOWO2_01_FULL_38_9]OGQ61569.1 MAG: NAD+ synthase [Deltaproteobacteria bacterium RIFCSPLOWO2_12_FULL_38_8]HBQ21757.1 NAD+ synthase [Deltaproteobacteria bacterium]
MKIALAQINPTIGAFEYNSRKMLDFIKTAKAKKAELVIFPELSLVGYPPLDLLEKESFVKDNLKYLKQFSSHIQDIAVICGFIDKNGGKSGKEFFNSLAFISNRKIIAKHHKVLLPSYDVFDETRHFEPGVKLHSALFHQHTFALSICEDIWNDKDFWKHRLYPKDPVADFFQRKKAILINISASPYSINKLGLRRKMLSAISKKYKVPSFYVNQVGSNDELIFDGGSFALDEKGKLIAQCSDFKEDLVMVDLEEKTGEKHAISTSSLEEVYKALLLGIQDYVRKCGFKKVLLGLSGGIDSALTAALATDALGKENVIGILMPSKYSSQGSIEDAKTLAKNLGIKTELIPIHSLFDSYIESLTPVFKNENSQLTQENLQARIRGNLLMALSNQWGALLLTTGNKSELGTGYCTLYGDMSGGLAVLADVPKTLVYELSRYMNLKTPVIPENSITKPPSAELRPNQTDQDTLPPYDQLDQILKAYIENLEPIAKIVKKGFSQSLVKDIVKRIDRNEYKRRQAPPALRISYKAFGIGRRLPIAQQYQESEEYQ